MQSLKSIPLNSSATVLDAQCIFLHCLVNLEAGNYKFYIRCFLKSRQILIIIRVHKDISPVVRPHATVDHAYVFSDGLHFVDTLFII